MRDGLITAGGEGGEGTSRGFTLPCGSGGHLSKSVWLRIPSPFSGKEGGGGGGGGGGHGGGVYIF